MDDLEKVCAPFNASHYYALLGIRASCDRPGHARVALPFKEELTQLYDAVHGGALLSIADAAVNVALASMVDASERTATIDLSMSFVAPPGRNDIVAEASVTERGKRVAFASCELRAGDKVIARAKGVCVITRKVTVALGPSRRARRRRPGARDPRRRLTRCR
jgi:uncharacterized protein (TIGR00369 family)